MAEPVSDPPLPSEETRRGPRMLLHVDVRTGIWLLIGILVVFTVFALARNTTTMLTRILTGAVLALALDGVVHSISRRWKVSRSLAVGIVGAALLALGLFVTLVLGPRAITQAKDFSKEIPQTVQDFYRLPFVGHALAKNDAAGKVQKWINELPANISNDTISHTAERLVGGVFSMVVVLFTTFALLLDGDRIVNRARRLIPAPMRDEADRVGRTLHRTVGRYFGGSLTVAALMGLFVLTIGLAFNVPLAPLAAIWAMFTDLIPQVGGFLGGAFLALLAVSHNVSTAVIVTILFVLYMNLENHFITPAIVGQAVNLTPPTTMLAAFIGAAVAGVPGALVATPLVGAAKQLYLDFRYGASPPEPQHRAAGAVRKLKHALHLGGRPDEQPGPETG